MVTAVIDFCGRDLYFDVHEDGSENHYCQAGGRCSDDGRNPHTDDQQGAQRTLKNPMLPTDEGGRP